MQSLTRASQSNAPDTAVLYSELSNSQSGDTQSWRNTVKKLTIMTFVNEVIQFLLRHSTCASQPSRQFLCSWGFRQDLPQPKSSWQGRFSFKCLKKHLSYCSASLLNHANSAADRKVVVIAGQSVCPLLWSKSKYLNIFWTVLPWNFFSSTSMKITFVVLSEMSH